MTAGVAAELAARISEECFDYLENPVVRVAGEDIPISVSVELEAQLGADGRPDRRDGAEARPR